jgi:hypothetical protein
MRETVGMAREVMGGNGIPREHGLVRFFAHAEASTPSRAPVRRTS